MSTLHLVPPKFAELVAAAYLDSDLATSYRHDPYPVLAEFGIELPAGAAVPALPGGNADVVIDTFIDEVPIALHSHGCGLTASRAA